MSTKAKNTMQPGDVVLWNPSLTTAPRIVLAITLAGFLASLAVVLSGCTAVRTMSDLSSRIATSHEKSAAQITASAPKIKENWPRVSGLIHGVMGGDFENKLPMACQNAAGVLDKISAQTTDLTPDEEGTLCGALDRFWWYGNKFLLETYGLPLWEQVKTLLGVSL